MNLCFQGLQDPVKDKGVVVASGSVRTTWPDPPPHDQVAKVARYIVHTSGKVPSRFLFFLFIFFLFFIAFCLLIFFSF